ncbi:hypothetical protein AALA22_10580 [Anaerovoracaceae bacterium 41-7]
MMINLILEHLQTDTALQTYLAQYAGKPAVFADIAPKESDAAWSAGSHYGQLLLHLQLQEDAAREGKNFLTAELLAESDSNIYVFMDTVRERLDGWFFAEERHVYSMHFSKAEQPALEKQEETAENLQRAVITFSVYEYPDQCLLPESPAALLSAWSKENLPQVIGRSAYLLGYDDSLLPQAFRPTQQKPAVYWRLAKTGKCESLAGGKGSMWRSAKVQCHVIIPGSIAEAGAMALLIEHALLEEGRIADEESFVIVGDTQGLDLAQDAVQAGQLAVEAIYPVIAAGQSSEILQHVSVAMKERE